MNRQKSFEQEVASLYLVPTPIGNLSEMTSRALETLNKVDVVACEDTRNTKKLLNAYNIQKPCISHHEHNQQVSIPQILEILEEGKSVAVVSDAGYPLVSDPGSQLVKACIEKEIPVISMSGANAAINALVASGLSAVHYLFYGFLDSKSSKRKKQLQELCEFPYTLIFYEAPHRIEDTLQDVLEVLGNRNICLARELTKLHEEYIRGSVSEVLEICSTLKGEMVLVVEGNSEEKEIDMEQAVKHVEEYVNQGLRTKEAINKVAKEIGCSKNELYNLVHQK
ncbi:MAG: 16S rRNA (cytidine(1402)-2'-O)-methyltransferase [Firmicutes bacterium]|nr:16S rRNA (cytidine(1402)-2'-O)-methyltransferase [Bacillota bacterium]